MTDPVGETRYPLGVLFVHGIGAQKRGETLAACSEPLAAWMHGWLSSSDAAGADAGARLSSPVRGDDGPLHRTLRLTPDDPDAGTEWLLAEAWWAEEFPPPSYRELVKWALAIGPWVIQRHLTFALVRGSTFADALRDEQRRWRTVVTTLISPSESLAVLLKPAAWVAAYVAVPVRQLLAFAMAVAIGIVAQLLVALLLVVGIVPVLRRWILRLQRAASESLGDCFALAMQPDAFASMMRRVDVELSWLTRHCDRVALVAHSQGAAISHRVVRERSADDVDLLLTYGAGIAKLTALRRVPVGRAGRWSFLRFTAVALWAVAAVVAGASLPLAALPAVAGAVALAGAARVRPVPDADAIADDLHLARLGPGRRLRWVDLWTAKDPVPEGSLATPPQIGLSSQEVVNQDAARSDHTTYWASAEGFVDRVSRELARTAEWSAYEGLEDDDDRLRALAAIIRKSRVEFLAMARFVAGFGWVAALVALGPRGLREIAGAPYAPLASHDVVAFVLGAIVVAVAQILVYRVVSLPAWRRWDRVASQAAAGRQPVLGPPPWSVRLATFALVVWWIVPALAIASPPSDVALAAICIASLFGLVSLVGGDDPLAASPAALHVRDRSSLDLLAQVTLPVPRLDFNSHLGLAADEHGAWVCCDAFGGVWWMSLADGSHEGVAVGGLPVAVDLHDGMAWVTSTEWLIGIDAQTREVRVRHRVEPGLADVAAGPGHVWVAGALSSTVIRVAADTGTIDTVVAVPSRPSGLVQAGGILWVTGMPAGVLTKLDARSGERLAEYDLRAVPVGRPAIAAEHVAVYDAQSRLVLVDPASGAVERGALRRISAGIGGLGAWGDTLWFVDGWAGTAYEFVGGRETRSFQFPGAGQEAAVTQHHVCLVLSARAIVKQRPAPAR